MRENNSHIYGGKIIKSKTDNYINNDTDIIRKEIKQLENDVNNLSYEVHVMIQNDINKLSKISWFILMLLVFILIGIIVAAADINSWR